MINKCMESRFENATPHLDWITAVYNLLVGSVPLAATAPATSVPAATSSPPVVILAHAASVDMKI